MTPLELVGFITAGLCFAILAVICIWFKYKEYKQLWQDVSRDNRLLIQQICMRDRCLRETEEQLNLALQSYRAKIIQSNDADWLCRMLQAAYPHIYKQLEGVKRVGNLEREGR